MQGTRGTTDSSTGVNCEDGEPICSTNLEITTSNSIVDNQFPNNSTSSEQPTYASSSSHFVLNHNNLWNFGESSSRFGSSNQLNAIGGLQTSGIVIRHNNFESSLGHSSQTDEERSSGPSSSLSGLGSSCKRKALEVAPSHSQYDASSSLSLSIPSQNVVINQSGQPEPRFGMGGGSVFPSTRTLSRPGRRLNLGQSQESVTFSFSQSGNSVRQQQQHVPATSSIVNSLDARAMPITFSSSSGSSQQSIVHLPALTRHVNQFASNASSSSRTEELGPPWDNTPRINSEQSIFTTPSTETTNPVQDQLHWSFNHVNPTASSDSPFIPREGSSSGVHHTWTTPNNQSMISEVAPWSLFPNIESESTTTNGGSLPLLPTVSSHNEVVTVPSGGSSSSRSHRARQRRLGLLLERQSDLLHLRHLGRNLATDNNGRNRIISEIRQVLSSMRRGENLRFEDYMLFDPLIHNGIAEMHDRHRDMRLDVDNMSYEELLALGERIGDVNTGLSEEVILKAMKQHKHTSSVDESHQEPCCVCQEEYVEGDDLGILGCGHEFHTVCVKQWLMLKNLCPICKTVALST